MELSYGVRLSELAVQTSASSASSLGVLFIADQEWFVRNATVLQLDYAGEPQRTIDQWSLERGDWDMFVESDIPGSIGMQMHKPE
jgi:hypothetical protein